MLKEKLKATHIVIVFLALILIFLILFFVKHPTQKIAVFDLKRTYMVFLHQAAGLPKQKMNVLAKQFPRAVTRAVNIYAQKHHAIVFVKSAVISGAEDSTSAIQALIAKEMHKDA